MYFAANCTAGFTASSSSGFAADCAASGRDMTRLHEKRSGRNDLQEDTSPVCIPREAQVKKRKIVEWKKNQDLEDRLYDHNAASTGDGRCDSTQFCEQLRTAAEAPVQFGNRTLWLPDESALQNLLCFTPVPRKPPMLV
jgi:hypothetical protein